MYAHIPRRCAYIYIYRYVHIRVQNVYYLCTECPKVGPIERRPTSRYHSSTWSLRATVVLNMFDQRPLGKPFSSGGMLLPSESRQGQKLHESCGWVVNPFGAEARVFCLLPNHGPEIKSTDFDQDLIYVLVACMNLLADSFSPDTASEV